LPVLNAIVPNLTGFDEISWTGGLPEGKAYQHVKQFLAALQIGNLLKFYNKRAA
jgi:hypothetical protein